MGNASFKYSCCAVELYLLFINWKDYDKYTENAPYVLELGGNNVLFNIVLSGREQNCQYFADVIAQCI